MTEAQPSEAAKPLDAIVTRVKSFDSGWAILNVERGGMPETWVGMAPDLKEGMPVRATGEWVKHEKFGSQFKFASLIVKMPDAADPGALATFLSKLVPGIGIRMTTHLVEALGADTIPALERNDYALIAAVKGIRGDKGEERARSLCEEWQKHSVEGQLIVQLGRFGIRGSVAKRIVKKYGGRATQMVAEHPYVLAMEVEGIGFKTADTIAKSVGIPHDSTERMEAGLLYTFEEKVSSRGHCYVSRESLFNHAAELLEIGDGPLSEGLAAGTKSGRFIIEGADDNPQIYLAGLHRAEVRVATRLARLLSAPAILRIHDGMPLDDMDFESEATPTREEAPAVDVLMAHAEKAIVAFEKTKGMTLADFQKDAVRSVMREKVFVLTGGPGVGKSTCLLALIYALETAGFDIAMCAPTGMAAKRMVAATGRPASTIHRLLEYNPEGGFGRNAGNKLQQSVVITDESSMKDIMLAANLLDAVDDGARFILVGDVDQLPSVGPGAVLRDVIESGVVPVVRLTQIFRQAEGSRIITTAHRVNHGEMPDKPTGASDFYWVERRDAEKAAEAVVEIVSKKLESRGISPRDCMVISPQKRGEAGVLALNAKLQEALNPRGPCLTLGKAPKQIVYRVGDRVMQTKNDYERSVFNGDVGWIKSVNPDKTTMVVVIDGRDVEYEKKHFDTVMLAYAVTGHKCVAPETIVETEGGLSSIADAPRAGIIAAPGGDRRYSGFVRNDATDLVRVMTTDGYELSVTPDHGIDVWRDGRYVRVEAKDVVRGDRLRLKFGVTVEPTKPAKLPSPPRADVRSKLYPLPVAMSDDLAEFLGLMVADGTVYRRGFRLVKRHDAVRERFAELCRTVLGATPVSISVLGTPGYEVRSRQLSDWLNSVGGLSPNEKYVPPCVATSHSRFHAPFLRGLFEDGSVHLKACPLGERLDHIEFTTKFRRLALMVRVMLLRLGIVAGTTRSRGWDGYKFEIYSEYAKRFVEKVGFISQMKRDRCAVPTHGSKYSAPISMAELLEIRPCISKGVFEYARESGRIARAQLEALAMPPSWLSERLAYHHATIASTSQVFGETMCFEVPDGHQFLQNGFAGWNCQGGQFKAVIVVMLREHFMLLSRPWLYTSLTRGEKFVVLIADTSAVATALSETKRELRNTGLRERLKRLVIKEST